MTENIELKPDMPEELYAWRSADFDNEISCDTVAHSADAVRYTRAKPEPITHVEAEAVDLETLKREAQIAYDNDSDIPSAKETLNGADIKWTIDYLSQRGLLKSPEHIEGLREDLSNSIWMLSMQSSPAIKSIYEAAIRYAAMMRDKS